MFTLKEAQEFIKKNPITETMEQLDNEDGKKAIEYTALLMFRDLSREEIMLMQLTAGGSGHDAHDEYENRVFARALELHNVVDLMRAVAENED